MTSFTGNLTEQPDLRYTPAGKAVTNNTIAVNRSYQVNGEWLEDTVFHRIAVYGPLAEHFAATLDKGSRVMVHGYFKAKEYTNASGQVVKYNELQVQEAGPSLRYVTCQIEKVAREYVKPTQSGSGVTSRTTSADGPLHQRNPDPVYGDEEPF